MCVRILGVTTSSSGDSQLGTTRVVFGVRMHVQGRLVPNSLPMRKKAETRPSVDLTNEAQHVGIREVSLHGERGREDNRLVSVCSFHH